KLRQRGLAFILSKFNINPRLRTISAFDQAFDASNWWMIPPVRSRWNQKITGNSELIYEEYLAEKYFKGKSKLKILALGSGICSHEMILAKNPEVAEIHCVDIAGTLLNQAATNARKDGLTNMFFHTQDIGAFAFKPEYYDVIFFHASLHHFANIDQLLSTTLMDTLKPKGKIVINEYVGPDRMQFPRQQIKAINDALTIIPQQWRMRLKTGISKNSVSGPGYLRMYLADPSECVESSKILPALRKYYVEKELKPYGGNLLMLLLKDIAHHFIETSSQKTDLLKALFELEDAYLEQNASDFVFGVYSKRL
ncbi:MAG: class I SAM-dependent methyltransferase, partial [Saprospiraceae bacterium]